MIHQLLALTRPLFVLDTETTGTDPQKDRIVELGFQQWDAAGMTKEWRTLVNPGVPIPASATKVHGITDLDMLKCRACGRDGDVHPYHETPKPLQGMNVPQMSPELSAMNDGCPAFKPVPRFKDIAANLAKGLADCDYAGQNVRFDLRILAAEMQRSGVTWSYTNARILDSSRLEALAVPRDLGSLHEKYTGKKHDGAHGALSDVRASVTVIAKQLETYPTLPRDLDALHKLQWPGFIDGEGKFRFIDGVPCFSQWGKYTNQPMRNADAGYWDFILKNDFSADVKALAADAKLGKYPVAP